MPSVCGTASINDSAYEPYGYMPPLDAGLVRQGKVIKSQTRHQTFFDVCRVLSHAFSFRRLTFRQKDLADRRDAALEDVHRLRHITYGPIRPPEGIRCAHTASSLVAVVVKHLF